MRSLYIIISTFLVISCGSQTAKETRQQQKDSSIVEMKTTTTVDTLFMDFFETFMWDKTFQKSRITFPITIDNETISDSSQWKHLSFYSTKEYYPILHFDTTSYFERDIHETSVGLIIANFKRDRITRYNFVKKSNNWFLTSSKEISIEEIPDLEFIDFIKEYSRDSVFQRNHTQFPVTKYFSDYEKDYEVVKTTITREKWENLNIMKGIQDLMILTTTNKSNKYRNIYYRGVENGIMVKYTFEKINGEWMFIKFEDYSD